MPKEYVYMGLIPVIYDINKEMAQQESTRKRLVKVERKNIVRDRLAFQVGR